MDEASRDQNQTGKTLADLRQAINEVDDKLLGLFNERAAISLSVGRLKKDDPSPVMRPLREAELLARLRSENRGPLPDAHLEAIYRAILSSSRALQKNDLAGVAATPGGAGENAARRYFGLLTSYETTEEAEEVFKGVESGRMAVGFVPIEHSGFGLCGHILELFIRREVFIQAEISCKISYSLFSANRNLSGISLIHAHPQALARCSRWLRRNLPLAEVTLSYDLDKAVERVSHSPGRAVIRDSFADRPEGLEAVASGIEDYPDTRTRFAVIARQEGQDHDKSQVPTKAAFIFRPGSGRIEDMAACLQCLAESSCRVHSIGGIRAPAEEGMLHYYVEAACGASHDLRDSLRRLSEKGGFFKWLGVYPAGLAQE